MTAASTILVPADSQRIALQVHELLSDIDPSKWRGNIESVMRERLQAAQEGMARVAASMSKHDGNYAVVRARFAEMAQALRDYEPRSHLPSQEAMRQEWESFRKRVLPVYESMAATLRAHEVKVPSLRPTNYKRSLFHLSSSLVAIAMSEVILPGWGSVIGALVFSGFAWSMEISRRLSDRWNDWLLELPFFKPIVHEQERYHVNSATWFATSLVILSLLDIPTVTTVGLLVLGAADPVAGLIGRRWGRTKLVYGKSVEGTVAFALTAFGVSLGGIALLHPSVGWAAALVMSASAAVVGAVTELYSKSLDDNFTIPVISSLGALLAAWAMGLGL